jgi:stress response protein YsnF
VQEVEEELSVGKRKAERKPASRTLSPEEAEAAFEGKTVEMLGTSEEAAVRKQARVVGEVALGKQVEEREETVKDTVRRTEVEVEEVGTKARKAR